MRPAQSLLPPADEIPAEPLEESDPELAESLSRLSPEARARINATYEAAMAADKARFDAEAAEWAAEKAAWAAEIGEDEP